MYSLLNKLPKITDKGEKWPWTIESNSKLYGEDITYPKISVVTASYNQAEFLEATIRSVLLQNYPNLEYIIIDGGSTDHSVSIIKKYEPWIKYWVSEKDNGCPDALNQGLSICMGDIFYYLNSDDYLNKDAFFKASMFILSNPGYDVYYGHGIQSNEIFKVDHRIYSSLWSLQGYISRRTNIVQQGTFFAMDSLKSDIMFNVNNQTCWDGELIVDLYLGGARFIRLPFDYNLATFRIHSTSVTGSQLNGLKYKSDIQRITEKIFENCPALKPRQIHVEFLLEIIFDSELIIRRMLSKIKYVAIKLASNIKSKNQQK